jgi:hypothetical protein
MFCTEIHDQRNPNELIIVFVVGSRSTLKNRLIFLSLNNKAVTPKAT